jgi:hypothetical protein
MQAGLLAGPIDLVASPIREIYEPGIFHFNDPSMVVVKASVVVADRGIVFGSRAKFGCGFDAPGNYGVGINRATIAGLDPIGLRSRQGHYTSG